MVIESNIQVDQALRDVNATAPQPICAQFLPSFPMIIEGEDRERLVTLSHRGRDYAYIRKVHVLGVIMPDLKNDAQYIDFEKHGEGDTHQYVVEANPALNSIDWAIVRGKGISAKIE